MPVALRCPCGFQAQVKDELKGKKIKCPQCRAPVVVGGKPAAAKKKKPGEADDEGLLDLNLDAFSNEEIPVIDPEVLKKQKTQERKLKAREERRKNSLGSGVMIALVFSILAACGVVAGVILYVIPAVKEVAAEHEQEADTAAPADEKAKSK